MSQPHSVALARHHHCVTENLKSVLRDNLRALLRIAPGKSGVSALIKLGLSNGNAQRALGAETSVGLDVIAQIAEAFGIEPWQLLVPNLDPERIPRLDEGLARWPFRKVSRDTISALVGTQAAQVETGLLIALASAGVSPSASQGPASSDSSKRAAA